MARLFWIGVGAAGAIITVRRVNEVARRYSPSGVAERVDAAGDRATVAVGEALGRFRVARTERERELVSALLVTPEGGDAGAVLRRGPRREEDVTGLPAPAGGATRAGAAPGSAGSRPAGRVDADEPLYEF